MEEKEKNMRLREWLIAQINSGKYQGLKWENQQKSMFKIPWKHAAKQDYRQNEDAALFKAWAVYKGKYREGRDRADPSAWKTRLRCALNKSTDFQEVPECSQLDISEPYKVYRILEDPERSLAISGPAETHMSQVLMKTDSMQGGVPGHSGNNGLSTVDQKSDVFSGSSAAGCETVTPVCLPMFSPLCPKSDFRLQVSLFYHGCLVQEVISHSPDGCFILHGSSPVGNERIYGPCEAQRVFFPRLNVVPLSMSIIEAMSRLLPHLEKGVLVWVAPDGVFIKRFCQGRVYWYGPLAENEKKPNKLDRERTCKLLDMQIFTEELCRHHQGEGPSPRYVIDLCFGEEFPDASQPKSRKLITAKVVPLFAKELLLSLQRPDGEGKHGSHSASHQQLADRGTKPSCQ